MVVEVSLTVGKLDASLALLLTKDHHLIEFPTILLPNGIEAGSNVTIRCEQNKDLEKKEFEQFEKIQGEILTTFGTYPPNPPNLKIRNITQTSCVLEWDPLDLKTADIISLTLYKNGVRLGQIPNPTLNTTTKLSGLPIDTQFTFSLKLDTTAGSFSSEKVTVHTHKMTDLSGITVCLGPIEEDGFTKEEIEETLRNMGAKPLQTSVKVDTTHFVCTVGNGTEWNKAIKTNIPIVRPEWLKACEAERRIVGVRAFYLGSNSAQFQNYAKLVRQSREASRRASREAIKPPKSPMQSQPTIEVEEPPEETNVAEQSTADAEKNESPTVPTSVEKPAPLQVTGEEFPTEAEKSETTKEKKENEKENETENPLQADKTEASSAATQHDNQEVEHEQPDVLEDAPRNDTSERRVEVDNISNDTASL